MLEAVKESAAIEAAKLAAGEFERRASSASASSASDSSASSGASSGASASSVSPYTLEQIRNYLSRGSPSNIHRTKITVSFPN